MLHLSGADALTPARLERTFRTLAAEVPALEGLEARFVHFADTARDLDEAERGVLERLLAYGPSDAGPADERGTLLPGKLANGTTF